VCRYTSLRPADIKEMEVWEFEVFSEQLQELLKLEAERGARL